MVLHRLQRQVRSRYEVLALERRLGIGVNLAHEQQEAVIKLQTVEMQNFKPSDVISFFGHFVYLVLSTRRMEGHRVELDIVNLMTGCRSTYEQGEHWCLGKVET